MPFSLSLGLRDFPKAVASVATQDAKLGVTKQGYRLDPVQEFTEALTGVKSIKPRVDRVLYYRALEAGKNVRDAGGIFNQVAKTRGNVDAETTTQAFITANEQRFKALRDLNPHAQIHLQRRGCQLAAGEARALHSLRTAGATSARTPACGHHGAGTVRRESRWRQGARG